MKESSVKREGTLTIQARRKGEALLDLECFKVRMNRLLSGVNEFWDTYRSLKKYKWDRCGDRE